MLQQYLVPQKLSQNKLARAIKVPPRRINEIIHEKRSITADTAVRLAIYFGISANYWMHLQAEYDIAKIKRNIATQLSAIQSSSPDTATQTNNIESAVNSRPETGKAKPARSLKRRIMR